MSVKIYTDFLLSSGGYNFKINYLKDKMRHGMRLHILLNNVVSSPLQQEYCRIGTGGKNAMKCFACVIMIDEKKDAG